MVDVSNSRATWTNTASASIADAQPTSSLQGWHALLLFRLLLTKADMHITKYIKPHTAYNDAIRVVSSMKPRKLELGDRNIIGKRVTEARLAQGMKQVELLTKLQLAGIDISVPALSLLEGQKRPVSDIELNALADILNVSVDWLLGRE